MIKSMSEYRDWFPSSSSSTAAAAVDDYVWRRAAAVVGRRVKNGWRETTDDQDD